MTGTVIKHTVARALVLAGATTALLLGSLVVAGPASADVPLGWPDTDQIETAYVLGVLIGIPVALFLLITLFVYLPGMVRGERVAPGATGPEDQWLGGRRNAGEIAYTGASTSTSASTSSSGEGSTSTDVATTDGGASARW